MDFGLSSANRVLKIDARSGCFKIMNGDEEVTFRNFRMEMDLENLQAGWCAFVKDQGLVFYEGVKIAAPDPIAGNEFKLGVRLNVFSEHLPDDLEQTLGLREIASTAIVVRRAFRDLYHEFEKGRETNAGCVPVVDVTGFTKVSMRNGVAYAPNFAIAGWTDRCPEFGGENPETASSDDKADPLDQGNALDEVLSAAKQPAI